MLSHIAARQEILQQGVCISQHEDASARAERNRTAFENAGEALDAGRTRLD